MRLSTQTIQDHNTQLDARHQAALKRCREALDEIGVDAEVLISKIEALSIAIPSWAMGAGGTRFGRFSIGGEPASLEQKLYDVAIINDLTASAKSVSLHIPWDIPRDLQQSKSLAADLGLTFDAINSNSFQDQKDQGHSYRHGSLSSNVKAAQRQAIDHNIEVINLGEALGSKALTVWLADGSNFPGQVDLRAALSRTRDALQEIYAAMPADWTLLVEYKAYEPNFYSTVIADWGTSVYLAESCGDRAHTLVDLGHHLPNTNIEQIVATLMMRGRLGGFHFNDSKYGDDDLTCGSVKPYQLFLIFNELVQGMLDDPSSEPAWMIDASHNIKDPLEDLIQSLDAILLAYAKALCINRSILAEARTNNDVVHCQEIIQSAFLMDLRPILQEARVRAGAAISPIQLYRSAKIREQLIKERGHMTQATGL